VATASTSNPVKRRTNRKDAALVERAKQVIPGGMYGHMSVQSRMPEGYPQFIEKAEGVNLWDADGNRYIDLMCAYGPMLIGYGHKRIDAAVAAQMSKRNTATGPAPVLVDLAEAYCNQFEHAQWCLFAKNGTDATTLCVTIARAQTGNRKILVAKGAYHGAAPWCTPAPAGVLTEDRAHLLHYEYNNVESLEAAAAQAGDDLAGVVASAFLHDAFRDQEEPTAEFARACRALCDKTGAALILDEVRAGLRLSLHGSWAHLGIEPDVSAWSKAIANGYPLAAVFGNNQFRTAASNIYATGSFWFEAGPMAGALETLQVVNEQDLPAQLRNNGERLRAGWQQQAQANGFALKQTGPVCMPMVLFDNDPKLDLGFRFVEHALNEGLYLHPWHNMFLSLGHTDAVIEEVLERSARAFAALGEAG